MRCPTCLELNSSGVRYCTKCGADLFEKASSPSSAAVKETTEVVKPVERDVRETAVPDHTAVQSADVTPGSISNSSGVDDFFSGKRVSAVADGDYTKATRMSRLAAVFIDSILIFLLMIPGMILSGAGAASYDDSIAFIGIMLTGLLVIIYSVYQLVILINDGQTIGKKMMKIKIVEQGTGENPGFVKVILLRSIVPSLINSVVGVFSIVDAAFIFGEEQRCLHDMIATTDVIDVS